MQYHDYEHPRLENLPLRYEAFMHGLSGVGADLGEVLGYIDALYTDKDLINDVIPGYLGMLKHFAVPWERSPHTQVKKGWRLLQNYFEPKKHILDKYRATPLIYGSLQYSDPRNLDFDVQFIGDKHVSRMEEDIDEWDDELKRLWGREMNEAEGHLSYNPIQPLQKYARLLTSDSRHKTIYENTPDIEYMLGNIAVALSGVALFSEDAAQVEALRPHYAQLLQIDPLVPVLVTTTLQDAVDTRKERRGLQ